MTETKFREAVQSTGLPTDRIEQFGSAIASWTSNDGSGEWAVVYHNLDSPFNDSDRPYWEYRSPSGRGTGDTLAIAIEDHNTQ